MKNFLLPLALCTLAALPLRAADPVAFRVGEFDFDRPASWAWVPSSSPMRKAQLSVTAADGARGEVIFFHFGAGQGGSVADNVNRWLAQFQNPSDASTQLEKIGDRSVTFVKAEGTFLSGMPGTPSIPLDGYALRGAILESPQGDVYVKFTGPKAVVEEGSDAFHQMIRAALSSPARSPEPST